MTTLGRVDEIILPGERLTRETFDRLRSLLQHRDDLVSKYRIAVLAPITGYAKQCIGSAGIEPDGWFLRKAAFRAQSTRDLSTMTIRAILPGGASSIEVNIRTGSQTREGLVLEGDAGLTVPVDVANGAIFTVEIVSTSAVKPSEAEGSSDDRELALLPTSIDFS